MIISKLTLSARCLREGVSSNVIKRFCCNKPGSEDSQDGNAEPLDGNKRGLVLGVYEDGKSFQLTPTAQEVDHKSGGKLSQQLNNVSERLRLGRAFVMTDIVPEYAAVALASFGPPDAGYNQLEELDETRENLRWGCGAGVAALRRRGCGQLLVEPGAAPDAAAEAAELAAWRFQEFKSPDARSPAPRVALYGGGGGGGGGGGAGEGGESGEGGRVAELWVAGSIRGRAQNWARFLSDMPANKMTPVDLAQAALDELCPLGVQVEAHDRAWIEARGMHALLAVARGSCEPPVLLRAGWRGAGGAPPVLLAAKGVTFDSGGLCLKSPAAMAENRGSMAGAAVALAAIKVAAQLKLPINIEAVIPLCENMVSGQCMKVGDVVRALNGLSIQIECTDLEGRLLLADALVYGQAQFRPALVVDVATLTHGVLLATGGGAFGCFSNSAAAWEALRAAGAKAGDRPWRLPLWHYYQRQVTDEPSVDLRNQGSGKATPCLGAAFLRHFVCCDWLHLDITGVGKLGHAPAPPYLDARRMSGRPARALAALLEALAHTHAHAHAPAHAQQDTPAPAPAQHGACART